MYRLIITIIIALMCNTISAQQLSEAEVAQYVNKALALQKVRKFNEARTLLNGIQPNVSSEIKNKLTQYISLVWYFEGSCYAQELQNQQAIHCMQNAREGFKSIGHKRYEANALFHIGNLKKEEYDFNSAIHHYQLALNTGRGNCTDEFIIEILTAQRKMAEFLGTTLSIFLMNTTSASKSLRFSINAP